MQLIKLKRKQKKLARMGGDSNMVIVRLLLIHQTALVEGNGDI